MMAESGSENTRDGGQDDDDGGGDRGAPRHSGSWVALASYDHPAEAHITRQKLESEGIDAYLDNENLVATDFLLSNATGGIKLMVREPDVAAAEAVLRSRGTEELALEPESVVGDDDHDDGYCAEDWRCPKCHRTEVELMPMRRRLAMLSLLLLGVPLLLAARRCRCRLCGHEWRQ